MAAILEQARRLAGVVGDIFEQELVLEGDEPKSHNAVVLEPLQLAQLRMAMACTRFQLAMSPAIQRTLQRTVPGNVEDKTAKGLPAWCAWALQLYCNDLLDERAPYFSPGVVWSTDILLALVGHRDALPSFPAFGPSALNRVKELVAEGRHNKPLRPAEVEECINLLADLLHHFNLVAASDEVRLLRDCDVRLPYGQLQSPHDANPAFSQEQLFVGGKATFKAVAESLLESSGRPGSRRNVLLTGHPGYGKSAIAGQLDAGALREFDIEVVGSHHCFRQSNDSVTPTGFLNSLLGSLRRALSTSFELSTFGGVLGAISAQQCVDGRACVTKICEVLHEEKMQPELRIIVVDGLNECLPTHGSPDKAGDSVPSLVAQIGRQLPHGFAVVATARPESSITEELTGSAWASVPLGSTAEAIADVEEYVRLRRDSDDRYAAAIDEDVIEELAEHSEGNFLVLKHELADAVREGRLVRLDAVGPETAAFHLQAFRQRFGKDAETYGDARKLLEIVAAAGGPLSREQLYRVMAHSAGLEGLAHPYKHEYFNVTWRRLRPFLVEEDYDDPDTDDSESNECAPSPLRARSSYVEGNVSDINRRGARLTDVTVYHSSLLEWLEDDAAEHPFRIHAERGHRMLARIALADGYSGDAPPDGSLMAGLYHCSRAGEHASDELMALAHSSWEGRDGDMGGDQAVFCTADSLELWLDLGASPRARLDRSFLFHVAVRLRSAGLVRRMLAVDRDSKHPLHSLQDDLGLTPLQYAAFSCNIAAATALLEEGASTELTLLYAVSPKSLEMIEMMGLLLAHGASPADTLEDGTTALHRAATLGSDKAVAFLLSLDIDVNTSTNSGYTPLHNAAGRNHASTVELLLKSGGTDFVTINAVKELQCSVFAEAALFHSLEAATILLEHGFDVNGLPGHCPPLSAAVVFHGGNKMVDWLIHNGADVNGGEPPPLHIASATGNADMVTKLVQLGADTSAFHRNAVSLERAAGLGQLSVVKTLLDFEASKKYGEVVAMEVAGLRAACFAGQVEVVNFFLDERGMDVNLSDTMKAPIFDALNPKLEQDAVLDVLRCLHAHSADFTALDIHRKTLLHYAALLEPPIVLEYLISEHGLDVEAYDSLGFTPLHFACLRGSVAAATALLHAGADVCSMAHEKQCQGGGSWCGSAESFLRGRWPELEVHELVQVPRGSPLHTAVTTNNSADMEYLIHLLVIAGAGVDVLAPVAVLDRSLCSPLHVAARWGHQHAVEALLRCGASPTLPDSRDGCPLWHATASGSLEVVQTLIDAGAGQGKAECASAMHLAIQQGRKDIIQILTTTPFVRELHEAEYDRNLKLAALSLLRGALFVASLPFSFLFAIPARSPLGVPMDAFRRLSIAWASVVAAINVLTPPTVNLSATDSK